MTLADLFWTAYHELFWTLFYGAFLAVALVATWHNRDLRWIAYALAVSFAASNATFFFQLTLNDRAGIYSITEILVGVITYCAFGVLGYRALMALVIVAGVSIGLNAGITSVSDPVWRQIHAWEVTTNVCFAAECVLAAGVGIADGMGFRRVIDRFRHCRRLAESYVARFKGARR